MLGYQLSYNKANSPDQKIAVLFLASTGLAGDCVVHGGCAAVNRGADYVQLLVPTLRA